MARNRIYGTIRRRTETRMTDESGQEVYRAQYSQETSHNPQDGSVNTITRAESTTLSSGETFHVGMSAGPNPVLLTGLCEFCRTMFAFPWSRRRNTHGLTNVKDLMPCHDCGRPACARHRRQSTHDKGWRCLKHHRIHKWKLRLQSIFFEVDDE